MAVSFGSRRRGGFGQMNRLAQLEPEIVIDLAQLDGGMDVSRAASDSVMKQPPIKSPLSENTRIRDGVVSKAFGLTKVGAVSAAGDKLIMAVSEFEQLSGTRLLMRVLNGQLERYDGASWLALNGALNGVASKLPSTLVVGDEFLIANGVDRLKMWDGGDGNAVADFSVSSPKAMFLAYFLGRIVAADIVNGARDTEKIQISDDVDNSDFAAGNSDAVIIEEDSSERPSPIHGLTILFKRFYVYRKHSVWIATSTGVPTSPLRFDENFSGLGLLSPKSLSRYDPLGDIFMGSDKQIHLFSGAAKPIPVGFPVQTDMVSSISDFNKAYGVVDTDQHRYWLMAPTFGSTWSNLAWVWEIDPWIEEQRLVWTRRALPVEMVSLGFGDVPKPGAAAFIDNETRFINDISELIDDWQRAETFRVAAVGGTDGHVRFPDETAFVDEGFGTIPANHDLPELGSPEAEIWLDQVYITYRSNTTAEIELSFSTDGGTTFGNPTLFTLNPSRRGSTVEDHLGLNFSTFIPRIRFTDDSRPEIIKLKFVGRSRGVAR